jgi:hypothetical protein
VPPPSYRPDRAIAHSCSHCQGANIAQASRKIFCGDSRSTFNIANLFSSDRPRVCTTVWRKITNCSDSFVIQAQQFWSLNHNPRSATKQRCRKHLIQDARQKGHPYPPVNNRVIDTSVLLFWNSLLGYFVFLK